jgi:hypothetical protein
MPGLALRVRLEASLGREREALESAPTHHSLVFELEQAALLAFMKQIRVHQDGDGFVLGVAHGPESYAGGLLALLLETWRPRGRPSTLGDAFQFEASARSLKLRRIFEGYRGQVYLPVSAAQADRTPPARIQLPRMRFRYPTQPAPYDTESYRFLGLLVDHEPDLAASWTNRLGQELSADLLLAQTRRAYLTLREPDDELEDHSLLHAVELLLAYDRRADRNDAETIQQRFLEVELARSHFEGDPGNEALAHYAESLGVLAADPRVGWTGDEQQRAWEWLGWLERSHFRDLRLVPLQHQAHLLRGLRLVAANRDRLGEPGRGSDTSSIRAP